MPKVKDIANLIEAAAPLQLALPWDNPGLLAGDPESEVKKILVALDTDMFTVNEAVKNSCDMIVSHHPILFGGTKNVSAAVPEGRLIRKLIQSNIAVYAAHTNMDKAEHGINARLAEMFKLKNVHILEPDEHVEGAGMGRFGELQSALDMPDFCALAKSALKTPFLRIAGNTEGKIKKLCIVSGAGADYIKAAKDAGCDALLTGDVKYHEARDAEETGITVADAGHFPTENIVREIFDEILKNSGAEIVFSHAEDAFKFIQ